MAGGQFQTILRYLNRLGGAPPTGDLTDRQLLERFTVQRDEAAFTALVQRHGSLVLGVCRRVLGHAEDAEDAFQATFLVLARKAASVRWRESVRNWLYGVAYRLAAEARARSARRREREREAGEMPPAESVPEAAWRELGAVLDEELHRLPDQYRMPLLLCYLEAQTRDQAAHQLGWSVRTLDRRLERGRNLLRARLTGRGLTLSAALLAAGLARGAGAAGLPAVLVGPTVRAAVAFAAGPAGAGEVSAAVVALAEGGLQGMAVGKMKLGMVLLLATGLLAAGTAVLAHQVLAAKPPEATQETRPEPQPRAPGLAQLAGVKPARTDRHGDPLPPGTIVRLGTIRFRCAAFLHYVAFTSDGRLLVSGGPDGACVWDAATGKEIRRLSADQGRDPFGPVVPSPDGKLVAVGGYDQNGMGGAVYELATGRRVYRFGKPGHSTQACFSPDGSTLAVSLYDDAAIDLHDAATGTRLRSLVGHEGRKDLNTQQARCAFSPDGKVLISVGADETIRFWNVATGRETQRLAIGPQLVTDFALSPDGSLLAAVCLGIERTDGQARLSSDDRIRLWELDLGKRAESLVKGTRQLVVPTEKNEEGRLRGHRCLAFSPGGKQLLVSGWDGKLRLVDPATGKELSRVAGYRGGLFAIAPDGKTFAESDHQAIRVKRLATGRDLVPTGGHCDGISAVFSPDERTAVTASGDGTIRLWDARTGQEQRQLARHEDLRVANLVYSPDGSALFAVGEHDKKRGIWDVMTGREIRRLEEIGWGLLALSPDGKTLASAGPGNTLCLNDAATGKELRTLKGPQGVVARVSFSGDGRTVLAWSFDKHLHSWDVTTGQHQRRPCDKSTYGVHGVAFSADGRLVALGGADHIAVCNVATGRELCRFAHGDGSRDDCVYHLAFAPDGRTLAWGVPRDAFVRLGEVLTGKERHRLAGHRGGVNSLVFSADSKRLLSGAADTTALIWDLMSGSEALPKVVAVKDLQALWADLAADAKAAYRASRLLVQAREQSVPFLCKQVRPAAAVSARQLERLLAQLDSDQFNEREQATRELEQAGEQAEPALRRLLAGTPSPEAQRRAEGLLARLDGPVTDPELLRALRALEVLEHAGTGAARQGLEALARGAPAAQLTREAKASLDRLARRVLHGVAP